MDRQFESAVLFTPGRSSFINIESDGMVSLSLSDASYNRAIVAAGTFEADYHEYALFAGGYPGVAQNWPPEHTPAPDDREAHHMAVPLKNRLISDGFSANQVGHLVQTQGESNNSIGDVLISIQKGFLDPNAFHDNDRVRGIDLVAGALHGARFRAILSKALDVDPKRIHRVEATRDIYGTPATEFQKAEAMPVAIAKELAAIAITKKILRTVRPGNMEDLAHAEERFIAIATRNNS